MTGNGRIRRQVNFANATALLALFVALGGTVYAAATIGASDIKRNAVRAKHIKSGNVKRSDVALNAINSARIAGGAVGNSDLAASSVDGSKVADGSIGPGEIGVTPQWSDVTFQAGWANYTSSYVFGAVQCYKDPFGFVHLRGAAERTGMATDTIAALPEACRVFPAGTAPELYAAFPVALVDAGGFVSGSSAAWVDGAGNFLGTDALPAVGSGFVFDGLVIATGAR